MSPNSIGKVGSNEENLVVSFGLCETFFKLVVLGTQNEAGRRTQTSTAWYPRGIIR